jgi:hypothetical protein
MVYNPTNSILHSPVAAVAQEKVNNSRIQGKIFPHRKKLKSFKFDGSPKHIIN